MTDPTSGSEPEPTTYHVLWSDTNEVILFLRVRSRAGVVDGESYLKGTGWVEDARAFDVYLNGQDYDLVDESEAADLVRDIEAGRA